MAKSIRLISTQGRWWWVAVGKQDKGSKSPGAAGKEFETRDEAIEDAEKRCGGVEIEN